MDPYPTRRVYRFGAVTAHVTEPFDRWVDWYWRHVIGPDRYERLLAAALTHDKRAARKLGFSVTRAKTFGDWRWDSVTDRHGRWLKWQVRGADVRQIDGQWGRVVTPGAALATVRFARMSCHGALSRSPAYRDLGSVVGLVMKAIDGVMRMSEAFPPPLDGIGLRDEDALRAFAHTKPAPTVLADARLLPPFAELPTATAADVAMALRQLDAIRDAVDHAAVIVAGAPPAANAKAPADLSALPSDGPLELLHRALAGDAQAASAMRESLPSALHEHLARSRRIRVRTDDDDAGLALLRALTNVIAPIDT